MTDAALSGIGVLVTRARHQADELVRAIEAHGGKAVLFPVIDIVPRARADVCADASKLGNPDIAIFVSPNAVEHGLEYAGSAVVAAIGPATAAAIEAAGQTVDIRPASGYDSEHLLVEASLENVDSKVIRIIRGQTGRELLSDTLRSRGASVDFLPVYERLVPAYGTDELAELEQQWRSGHIAVVTVMSAESLTNLIATLPESCRNLLGETPLVTPAARVIKEALERFPSIQTTLARGPLANDMVHAIMELGLNKAGHT